eukprot:gene10473-biopygen13850
MHLSLPMRAQLQHPLNCELLLAGMHVVCPSSLTTVSRRNFTLFHNQATGAQGRPLLKTDVFQRGEWSLLEPTSRGAVSHKGALHRTSCARARRRGVGGWMMRSLTRRRAAGARRT